MTDREDAIKRIERVIQMTNKGSITVTIPKYTAELVVSMLKEQRWHVFYMRETDEDEKKEYPNLKYITDVDCVPGNGEEFLWYRKYSGDISIATWDDDMWAEYCDTGDGDHIEEGDAWMELPKPPAN